MSNVVLADTIPAANQHAVAAVLEGYGKQCAEELGNNPEKGLRIRGDATYQLTIDDNGTSATVLISDFSCGDLGPIWCGTGGCDTYLFVDGKTFVWRVSWTPLSVQLPTHSKPHTALLFPLSGAYCSSASGTPTSIMMSGCYAVASWDSERETFVTTVSGLKEVDLNEAYSLKDNEP